MIMPTRIHVMLLHTPFSSPPHSQNVLQNFINTANPEVSTAKSKRGRPALTDESKAHKST